MNYKEFDIRDHIIPKRSWREYVSQDGQCPSRDSNREPFGYKSGALLPESAWSILV
jgi:hypothetical protein